MVWLPVTFILGAVQHPSKTEYAKTLTNTAVDIIQDVLHIFDFLKNTRPMFLIYVMKA